VKHASFVLGSWVITFVSVAVYAGWIIRRGRDLARNVKKEDLPWT
jgi:heme exporter protein CcmD